METLKLQESELAEMKQFYQEEYERLTRRIQHIATILSRLGTDPEQVIPAPLMQSSNAIKAGSYPSRPAPVRKKKSGRKSKWELLIMKRLRQLDKPVTYEELTDEIMAFSRLPDSKRTSTKQAIVNVIFRLRNQDKKLDTFSIGTKEKYIALKSWFSQPGEIRKEYLARINAPIPKKKTTTSRRGRPPKNSQS